MCKFNKTNYVASLQKKTNYSITQSYTKFAKIREDTFTETIQKLNYSMLGSSYNLKKYLTKKMNLKN